MVYIAWDGDTYSGYWDLAPDGPTRCIEEMPLTAEAASAISWARERTPAVLIRPRHDPDTYYWVGTARKPEHARWSEVADYTPSPGD